MQFHGRDEQRKRFARIYKKNEQQVALLFGRRRVGKSELIKQSIRETDLRSIYFECKQTTEPNNVESLCTLIAELFQIPKPAFRGIEELMDYLFREAEKEPLILVLDEYPYLRETVKGLDSIMQSLIDRYKDSSKIKLILCGSYVDVMKSLLIEANPLYGRVDLTIELKPMDYYESASFYPSFSDEDKVRLYSVFGGIPYYNRLIDSKLSAKENIIELIASPGARLENEVIMYLKAEISKLINANEVFEALAKGYSRYADILSQSHVSSSPTLADTLEKLIRMDVVAKESPINDPSNKRKTGYYISDNLSLFYYRYIYRHLSQMSIMDPEVFYQKYIENDFEEIYVPYQFERLCTQYLIRENRQGRIEPIFERIGKYYYDDPVNRTNGEFDIVTEDENGYVFYEAKFRKNPLHESIIRHEIEQVKATGMNCYKYGFISRSGFDMKPDEDMIFISLAEMYACQ